MTMFRNFLLAMAFLLISGQAVADFTLPNGVSAGDVTQHSAVLWTRSTVIGNVTFTVCEKFAFRRPVVRGRVKVRDVDQPVKFKVEGLKAGTRYFYRVRNAKGDRLAGTFKTIANVSSKRDLQFGVSGDWRGELSPYPAISNAWRRKLDFFVKLGDTIYADYPSPAVDKPQAETLQEFRLKHAEVYSTRYGINFWAFLQMFTPVYATIDDHEVMNDFAGGAPAASDPRFGETNGLVNQTQLYNNGLQAFNEYNAIEVSTLPVIGDVRTDNAPDLYRTRTFGQNAAMFMVDARSFRDQELPAVQNPLDPEEVGAFLALSFNINPLTGELLPPRTMLSERQVERLLQDLLAAHNAGVTWKFIMLPEPIQNLGVIGAEDRFEGYAAERTAILKFIDDNNINNVVFVSADIHGTLVNNLTYQMGPGPAFPQIPSNAFEITTGSVAFDAPFGPTILGLAAGIVVAPGISLLDVFLEQLGLPNIEAFNALPETVKNTAVESLVNQQLAPLGYDLLGLQDSSEIQATLTAGTYTAVFNFGWTEFDIESDTKALTVTTYGIDPYNVAELNTNPAAIVSRTPRIISQFVVTPQ